MQGKKLESRLPDEDYLHQMLAGKVMDDHQTAKGANENRKNTQGNPELPDGLLGGKDNDETIKMLCKDH